MVIIGGFVIPDYQYLPPLMGWNAGEVIGKPGGRSLRTPGSVVTGVVCRRRGSISRRSKRGDIPADELSLGARLGRGECWRSDWRLVAGGQDQQQQDDDKGASPGSDGS